MPNGKKCWQELSTDIAEDFETFAKFVGPYAKQLVNAKNLATGSLPKSAAKKIFDAYKTPEERIERLGKHMEYWFKQNGLGEEAKQKIEGLNEALSKFAGAKEVFLMLFDNSNNKGELKKRLDKGSNKAIYKDLAKLYPGLSKIELQSMAVYLGTEKEVLDKFVESPSSVGKDTPLARLAASGFSKAQSGKASVKPIKAKTPPKKGNPSINSITDKIPKTKAEKVAQLAGVSEDEAKALLAYTDKGYKKIAKALHSGQHIVPEMQEIIDNCKAGIGKIAKAQPIGANTDWQDIKGISSYTREHRLNPPGIVSRLAKIPDDQLAQYQKGERIKQKGFTSTSAVNIEGLDFNSYFSRRANVQIDMELKENSSGAFLPKAFGYDRDLLITEEAEVLFAPGLEVEVLERKEINGKTYLKLREL